MILVETQNFKTFQDYIASLGKPAKKNFEHVQKHNRDVVYEIAPYDRTDIEYFMRLWEQQLIRGKTVTWAFPVEHVEDLNNRGVLKVFRAMKGQQVVAMHFVEVYENYVECHPPMYEKSLDNLKRYVAKFMWFGLINYAISEKAGWILDFGGGQGSWRNVIRNRDQWLNPRYKWMYIPEEVKQNPDKQPDYEIINDGVRKACVLRT